jgi:hypothetical protein
MTHIKALRKYICGMVLLLLFCESAQAEFRMPIYAPVDRLIQNAAAYVRENPNNANGYYILGRIHYLAFANKSHGVGILQDSSPPDVAPDWLLGDFQYLARRGHAIELTLREFGCHSQNEIQPAKSEQFWQAVSKKERELNKDNWKPETISENEMFEHALEAMKNFKKAIELNRKNGLYYLGLASLIEQYTEYLKKIDINVVPEKFRNIILDRATDAYYTAYELSIREDLNNTSLPVPGLRSMIGYEAGRAYARLVDADRAATQADKEKATKVKIDINRLEKLPRGAITPIVFSMDEMVSPGEMIFTDTKVRFDLDGDGLSESRQWVRPSTGILVWDPQNKGEITSGRQMFGSVSWWMFFSDGYQALNGLDDNRDGVLSGSELVGISVWFDKNSNGKSEAGEVLSLEQLQIVSIACRSTGTRNNWSMNEKGIMFKDGRTVPTYDWISEP